MWSRGKRVFRIVDGKVEEAVVYDDTEAAGFHVTIPTGAGAPTKRNRKEYRDTRKKAVDEAVKQLEADITRREAENKRDRRFLSALKRQ